MSNLIEIPKEINYCELYFTLRCNLHCDYCLNAFGDFHRVRREISAEVLAEGFNRLEFDGLPLTIGGGEPTVRKDFYTFLEVLRPDIGVDLLSNVQFDVEDFIKRVSPTRFSQNANPAYKSIRISYHPSQMDPNILIRKVQRLQEAGFQVGIFGISHPLNMEANIQMSELARKAQVYFFIKDFLGDYRGKFFGFYKYPEALDGQSKSCRCRTKELLIGPDGNIYKCHRDLYAFEFPVKNLMDDDLKIEYVFRDCDLMGQCHPCDIKEKVNRFLDMGNCAVEIQ